MFSTSADSSVRPFDDHRADALRAGLRRIVDSPPCCCLIVSIAVDSWKRTLCGCRPSLIGVALELQILPGRAGSRLQVDQARTAGESREYFRGVPWPTVSGSFQAPFRPSVDLEDFAFQAAGASAEDHQSGIAKWLHHQVIINAFIEFERSHHHRCVEQVCQSGLEVVKFVLCGSPG